jgi:hypothetical protein
MIEIKEFTLGNKGKYLLLDHLAIHWPMGNINGLSGKNVAGTITLLKHFYRLLFFSVLLNYVFLFLLCNLLAQNCIIGKTIF